MWSIRLVAVVLHFVSVGPVSATRAGQQTRQAPVPVVAAERRAQLSPLAAPVVATPTRPGRRYVPPVDAIIVDHFRPPACRWCPGNRGIDYATVSGGPVTASAAGVVTFAGQVGGQLFVVVAHPDGLRTTYAFVQSIVVTVGERVAQGDIVATSADRLHFGVRRGDVYLDPELLFEGAVARARLVPTDGSAGRRAGWARAPALR